MGCVTKPNYKSVYLCTILIKRNGGGGGGKEGGAKKQLQDYV